MWMPSMDYQLRVVFMTSASVLSKPKYSPMQVGVIFHPTKSESLCAIWHSWTVTGSLMQSNRPTNAISISSDFHRVEPLISMMPCDPLPLPFPPKRACYEHMESHRGTRSVVYSWTALNFGLQNATNSRTRNTFHLYFDYIACWLFCLIPK